MNGKIAKQVLLFAGLFTFAVPWYWQYLPEISQTRWLGLPIWVIGCVAGSGLISLQTARVLQRPWEGEDQALQQDGQR